ncbi:MAG: helix-turn-helix domain-containing protein [Eggerthellaceae bacterium]|nr:helix-turn-helix domain-containing protein [Eggerthellaceae bacterium]
MKLNLAIIYEDLNEFEFTAQVKTGRMRRALDFAAFPEKGTPLRPNILYIVTREELERKEHGLLESSPSLLCIGVPPDDYLQSKICNVIWTTHEVSREVMLTRVLERFTFYNQWYSAMQSALARDVPLKALGQISSEVFKKPIWMWDKHYRTVFNVVDERFYTVPETYTSHDDDEPWPLWEINAWKDGGLIDVDEVLSRRGPYILPSTDMFDYRSLAYNLFIGNEYAATLTIEEVGSPITSRDYALIERFASLLVQGLKRSKRFNASATVNVVEEFKRLLEQRQVPDSSIQTMFKNLGWEPVGPFSCVVAHPVNPLYSDDMLAVTAAKTCEGLEGVVYVVDNHEIVFIINTRIVRGTLADVVSTIAQRLSERQYQTVVGVSSPFPRITDLYHYRRQATNAVRLGRQADEAQQRPRENACYYAEDYILDYIIDKCSTRVLPETLCPPGLINLMDYDRDKGCDLCHTLHVFLRNNMQITETARQLFMHRNTLLNKLHKIDNILLIDLNDPDARLLLLLSFKILESRGIFTLASENERGEGIDEVGGAPALEGRGASGLARASARRSALDADEQASGNTPPSHGDRDE